MSDRGTSSIVSDDTDADSVPTADAAPLWAPHGRALTGCLVVVNVALVLLVYLYFWRVFSRKRAAAASGPAPSDDEEDDASSSASAPPAAASARTRDRDDVLASLPVFVVRSSAGGGGEKAEAECAVCIAELRDGDKCRALPRCGHRFHAACVDGWLRLHTTCPLCRASVVVVAAPERKGGVADTMAAAEDVDAHV